MSKKIGYDLKAKQTQNLVMTPELIQAIKILQFNAQELDSYVQEQLLENPVLEQKPGDAKSAADENGTAAGDDLGAKESSETNYEIGGQMQPGDSMYEALDWKEYIRDRQLDETGSFYERDRSGEEKENAYEKYVSSDLTLSDYLRLQLQLATDEKEALRIGRYIIETLDDNGYMTSGTDEIAEELEVSEEETVRVLKIIRGFDPSGIGAKDIRECLLIQLKNSGQLTELFEQLINEHLEDLALKRFETIADDMQIPTQQVQQMTDVIRTLEPKPGRMFSSQADDTGYIIPDVIVEKTEKGYKVTVNEINTPRLMISSYYRKLMSEADGDETLSKYISERINSAVWLIKSIEQRRKTVFSIVTTLVKRQEEFLEKGNKYLKTMTLKDIADELGIHESTVSRAVKGKYLQCKHGVFELKYFFSSGVHDSGGEGISSKSVKEFIREIIESEDVSSPYSDQAIAEMLKNKGIDISRRTVAKYRDELGILSSSKRRRR